MDITIIIPVYCNQGNLHNLYKKLTFETLNKFSNLDFEIIIIDDGSTDQSYIEMCELKKLDERIKLVKFTRNFGQVAAIYAGYKLSKGKGILNISADGQEPSSLLNDMINSFVNNEAPIIAGNRISRDESYYRKKTSQIFYFSIQKLGFPNMPYTGFDIVLLTEKIKNELLNSEESNPFWQGHILWLGHSVKFLPYNRLKREVGVSKWSFSKKLKYLLDGVLNYSYAPLRFFSLLGAISFIFGILYTIVILISYFEGNSPFKGWAPLMIVILLCSGLQLMMTGLIGEYLWRTLEQVKNRPNYIIEEIN